MKYEKFENMKLKKMAMSKKNFFEKYEKHDNFEWWKVKMKNLIEIYDIVKICEKLKILVISW